MNRDKFMFFDNFKETADRLPDDLRLKFYDAMTDYVFKGVEPDDVIISALITAIKPSLDKEDKRGGIREGAGAPKNNQNAKMIENKTIKNNQNNQKQSKQSILSETETETETKEKNTLKGIQKEKKIFQKPSLEEVKSYCQERGNNVDAERWINYYESNGWKVGKNSMKDWRAAVRTWERGSFSAPASCKTADDAEYWQQIRAEAQSYERAI